MRPWQKICCAIDFSPASQAAMETAAILARRLDVPLTLVMVEPRPENTLAMAPELAETERRDRDYKIAEWRERAKSITEHPVVTMVASGEPANQIVQVAGEEGFDLVVLGTHGRTGIRRAVLGSVAEAVIRHAPCAVLTVHEAGPAPMD